MHSQLEMGAPQFFWRYKLSQKSASAKAGYFPPFVHIKVAPVIEVFYLLFY